MQACLVKLMNEVVLAFFLAFILVPTPSARLLLSSDPGAHQSTSHVPQASRVSIPAGSMQAASGGPGGAPQGHPEQAVKYSAQGEEDPGVIYDENDNAYMRVPEDERAKLPLQQEQVEAAAGPIWQAIKDKVSSKKGGEDPEITYVPLPPRQAAPAPAPPMQAPPQAHATATAPTTPTTVGSGGIQVTTSTPTSVSNPIKITSPSSSAGGGWGWG